MATNGIDRDRSALIVYGTETGNAQDVAEEVGRNLERIRFITNVTGLDTISASELSQYKICLFVVSTTGQGDFPSNARKFWTSLLKKKLTNEFLNGVNFALIGIGDTSYPKFNYAARKLGKRLKQLGAYEIFEACEADEQSDEGTGGSILTWSQGFLSELLARHPLREGQGAIPKDIPLPSKWELQVAGAVNGQADGFVQSSNLNDSFRATLRTNERVTPSEHWQDVRFLTLTTEKILEYHPGDALAILPKNSANDVDALVRQMKWDELADIQLRLTPTTPAADIFKQSSRPTAWPSGHSHLTLRDLLLGQLDITAIPRRSFFSKIAEYTSDASHKERLLEFTNQEFIDEYFDYATRPRRSMLEVLQEFASVKIPWQEAINVFPALRPRQFSIASGGILKKSFEGGTKFELLVAIVKYRTVIKKIREGVCTRYLAALPVGANLEVALRTEGRFDQTHGSHHLSHVLIGTGTGIAPLRSLVYAKQYWHEANLGTILIFGSRSANADFFFEQEWAAMNASHPQNNLQVITAFSRDQKQKVYVQDRIRENANTILDYICNRRATIVVCGSSGQMPKDVREALVDILSSSNRENIHSHLPNTREDAEAYLNLMEKRGRYKQETW